MRKLTQESVEAYFKNNNCELLSNYVNSRQKVKYKCECGNISEITLSDFKIGRRCGCGNKKSGIKRRHDIENVKTTFANNQCLLLEEEYKNNKHPMNYICSCGKTSKICFSSFKQGRRCKECGINKNKRPLAALNLKLKKKYNAALRETFKATGQRKNTKSRILLGYGVDELRDRILNHPNWHKVKDDWQLDHIFPIKAFIEHKLIDAKLINSLDNLQPLKSKDNMIKKDKYKVSDFKSWLFGKGINI